MSEDDVRRIVREEIDAALSRVADSMLLDSTWAMYGGKPSDPTEQARIGQEYAKARYGGSVQTMTNPYRKDFKCS